MVVKDTDINFEQYTLWEGDPASFFSHQSSRLLSQDHLVLEDDHHIDLFSDMSKNAVNLPAPYVPKFIKEILLPPAKTSDIENKSFTSVIRKRKTSRNFDQGPISLDKISTLLYFSMGLIHGTEWAEFDTNDIPSYGIRTASPSTTGLQGCEGYLVVQNVTGLEKGIYLYSRENHSLYQTQDSLENTFFSYATLDQFWSSNLSAGIFIVTEMKKMWVKNKLNRSYLMCYADAGHLSQTILLTATALGIHTWMSGTFRDDYVSKSLQIDGTSRFASFFVGLGYGNNESIPQKFIDKFKGK